jgi:hypothetical protein
VTLDLRARQDTYNGFGNAFSRALELVLTPLLFAGLGWLFSPVAALVLGVLAVVGQFVRVYFQYAQRIDAEQARILKASRS